MTDLNSFEENVDAVQSGGELLAGDHTLAERGREIVFDLAQNSDMLAYDLARDRRAGGATSALEWTGRAPRRSIVRSIGPKGSLRLAGSVFA